MGSCGGGEIGIDGKALVILSAVKDLVRKGDVTEILRCDQDNLCPRSATYRGAGETPALRLRRCCGRRRWIHVYYIAGPISRFLFEPLAIFAKPATILSPDANHLAGNSSKANCAMLSRREKAPRAPMPSPGIEREVRCGLASPIGLRDVPIRSCFPPRAAGR